MAELSAEMTALLSAVRNYLDITWTDADLDSKLVRLIEDGQDYVDKTSGETQDYSVKGQARSLLFDYVRYARSGASEMFWKNYQHELIALRLESGVTAYEAESTDG